MSHYLGDIPSLKIVHTFKGHRKEATQGHKGHVFNFLPFFFITFLKNLLFLGFLPCRFEQ